MSKDLTASMLLSQPHRRYNALTDEWLLVSAERTSRPWLGREEDPPPGDLPAYDPTCYLCPGNVRANGDRNPQYGSTFVFTNDFAALQPDLPSAWFEDRLLLARSERGTCHVICFSPRHDLTLSRMTATQARRVVDLWATETADLGETFEWVQVFENRGTAMGSSNPHPHGQIWAGDALPREAVKEDATQRRHFESTGRRLLLDYAEQEAGGLRELAIDDDWLVVVPFWAAWPFETLIVPRHPVARIPDLNDRQRDSLAERLTELLRGYDGLFDEPFPYSMGWHQAPFDGEERPHWQLHAHFYPPLLQATVRKFMVGYELLSEPQRDITAEDAAEQLRSAIKAANPNAAHPGG
ncbi:MAG TPA: UDP-glucose--hexose-1-phosphate uridylyltransferase [Candidatus Limnocylindrales bacterium]